MTGTYKPLKVGIFDNRKTRYTMAQVKKATGADIVFNGSLFNWSDYSPCCDIRIGGKTLNDDEWGYYGYGWNDNELPKVMHSKDMFSVDNYLSCIWAIHNGEKQTLNDNASGIGGTRGRTAFGFKADGTMVIICTSDAKGAMKLSQVRDSLYDEGCISGIILDGGGSSQIDTPDEDVASSRIVSNFVCVWVDKSSDKKEDDTKMKVCLDAGHGGNETSNGSPDGTYKEHEFTLDLAKRIKLLLERCGVEVTMTRETNTTVSLTQRATIANNADVDLFVSIHSNASGSAWSDASGLCVYTYAAGGERDRAANLLLTQMASAGVKTFGSKLYHAKFTVIANTNMPAYLVEYAFHTNKADVELLKSDTHRDKLAIATAKAICEYGGVTWIDEPATAQPSGSIYRVIVPQTQVGAFTDKLKADNLVKEYTIKGLKPYITTEVKA